MRSKRKALQETKKSGLVNQKVTSRVARKQLHNAIDQNDLSRLENEGGPEALISGDTAETTQFQSAETAFQRV